MKLIVFGATGSVGLHLIAQALEQGHTVTAFTRSPEKLAAFGHDALRIFKGDILDAAAVAAALQQQEAVLCAIGDGGKGAVRAAGTQHIISAMHTTGVQRLICETTLGMGDSEGNLNFFWRHIMFGILLKKAFRDHQQQERHVFDSRLDFTIVRPGAFTNGPVTGAYQVGFDGRQKKLRLKIARADVADFMLKQLHSDAYLGKAVSISD